MDFANFIELKKEIERLKKEVSSLSDALQLSKRECCRLRIKLGIRKRNLKAKAEIFSLMDKGLRNCEIQKMGYSKSTVKACRAAIKKAAG